MALVVSNIVKKFGGKIVVDKIGFEIREPGVFGLLGTNGAGKTTTIRMLLGILDKDRGSIEWKGKPVNREHNAFGYLPEERGIYPKHKIKEQIMYFAKLRGIDSKTAKASYEYWSERLQVAQYSEVVADHLSKGNQQKIQLLASLIHEPELIILDEPFSGLDPININLLKSVIYELVEKGRYIVMSSHQMQVVEEYCMDIIILEKGRSVVKGNLKEIKRGYGRTNLFVSCDEQIDKLINKQGIIMESKTPEGYELKIKSEKDAQRLLEELVKSKIIVNKFEIREPSLQEIFVDKVGA